MQCGLSTGQSEVAADINCDDDIGHMDTHDDDGALKYKKKQRYFVIVIMLQTSLPLRVYFCTPIETNMNNDY